MLSFDDSVCIGESGENCEFRRLISRRDELFATCVVIFGTPSVRLRLRLVSLWMEIIKLTFHIFTLPGWRINSTLL